MKKNIGDIIRKLRIDRGFSQQQLADSIFVDRSTYAGWETGRRMIDTEMLCRICDFYNIDVRYIVSLAKSPDRNLKIIMVDDEKIVLTGGLPVLKKVFPSATIIGFTKCSEAIEYVKNNHVSLAFLDIEMGKTCGLNLCEELIKINPDLNVIFLTAYANYSIDAWKTGASGFVLKPISVESIKEQLNKLRFPVIGGVS